MDEYGLGPNGAMLYCVEYLEANFDWLVDELDRVLEGDGGNGYVVFDTPGQAELWTNHDSLRKVMERLTRMEYRVSQTLQVASEPSCSSISARSSPSFRRSLHYRWIKVHFRRPSGAQGDDAAGDAACECVEQD